MPNLSKPETLNAASFLADMTVLQSDEELEKIQRYFKTGKGQYAEGDWFIGVRMGEVFSLAKEYIDMPIDEIELLLESQVHEARAGAMSIMDKCARRKATTPARREEMFDLYLRRHDRINNWDLVDLAAIHVVGGYLIDKDRSILVDMAHSENVWERRTAIVATAFFTRHGELDDTYAIAKILLEDEHDLIQKAVGGWLRETGKRDRGRLVEFLEIHAARMPRTMLRYAIEHFDDDQKKYFRGLPGL
jgi:3-methyladenine DNA glycosylase AlkD